MCTPVGHVLAGWAVSTQMPPASGTARPFWTFLGICIAAVLPDFDFIPGLLRGNPGLYHHGVSHSLGFAFSVGLVAGLAAFLSVPRRSRISECVHIGGLVFLILLSHLVLDFFTGDREGQIGLPLFWPVSGRYMISPKPVFLDVFKDSSSGAFFRSLFVWHNALAMVQETAILGPVAAWAWWRNRCRAGKFSVGKSSARKASARKASA
jgi:inner membrane protein